jgi:hypothetical protein
VGLDGMVYTQDHDRQGWTGEPQFKPNDPVNLPNHYTDGGIECIDAIQASMTPDEFRGMLKGNAMKYLWRYRLKGKPVQDLEKAAWYLHKLIELEKGAENGG